MFTIHIQICPTFEAFPLVQRTSGVKRVQPKAVAIKVLKCKTFLIDIVLVLINVEYQIWISCSYQVVFLQEVYVDIEYVVSARTWFEQFEASLHLFLKGDLIMKFFQMS